MASRFREIMGKAYWIVIDEMDFSTPDWDKGIDAAAILLSANVHVTSPMVEHMAVEGFGGH